VIDLTGLRDDAESCPVLEGAGENVEIEVEEAEVVDRQLLGTLKI
jgi:hypothetical protein